jgi:hypothetical protein
MNWKQFLKPNWRKSVLFIIIAILGSFFILYGMNFSGRLGLSVFDLYSILFVILNLFLLIIPILSPFFNIFAIFIGLILNFFYWYFLACLIVWIYDKFRKPKKK